MRILLASLFLAAVYAVVPPPPPIRNVIKVTDNTFQPTAAVVYDPALRKLDFDNGKSMIVAKIDVFMEPTLPTGGSCNGACQDVNTLPCATQYVRGLCINAGAASNMQCCLGPPPSATPFFRQRATSGNDNTDGSARGTEAEAETETEAQTEEDALLSTTTATHARTVTKGDVGTLCTRGVCQDADTTKCIDDRTYVFGQCPGGSNIKCCQDPAGVGDACTHGVCLNTRVHACGGRYVPGLCRGGGDSIQCCQGGQLSSFWPVTPAYTFTGVDGSAVTLAQVKAGATAAAAVTFGGIAQPAQRSLNDVVDDWRRADYLAAITPSANQAQGAAVQLAQALAGLNPAFRDVFVVPPVAAASAEEVANLPQRPRAPPPAAAGFLQQEQQQQQDSGVTFYITYDMLTLANAGQLTPVYLTLLRTIVQSALTAVEHGLTPTPTADPPIPRPVLRPPTTPPATPPSTPPSTPPPTTTPNEYEDDDDSDEYDDDYDEYSGDEGVALLTVRTATAATRMKRQGKGQVKGQRVKGQAKIGFQFQLFVATPFRDFTVRTHADADADAGAGASLNPGDMDMAQVEEWAEVEDGALKRHRRHHHHRHHHADASSSPRSAHSGDGDGDGDDGGDPSRFAHTTYHRNTLGKGSPPLVGGASIGVDINGVRGATMGGVLISDATSADFRLFGLTNHHVLSSFDAKEVLMLGQVCQPAHDISRPPPPLSTFRCQGACQKRSDPCGVARTDVCDAPGFDCCPGPTPKCSGKCQDSSLPCFGRWTVGRCPGGKDVLCCLAPAERITTCDPVAPSVTVGRRGSSNTGGKLDFAVFPILKSARFNTMCAVMSDQSTTPVTVVPITGTARAVVKQQVWKYGERTHRTSAAVLAVDPNQSPFRVVILGSGFPAFADGSPQSATGAHGGPPQVSPANEATFWEQQMRGGFDDISDTIAKMTDLRTGRVYGSLKAADIVDKLWAEGLLEGMFGTHGDSGSIILDNTGGVFTGTVVAQLDSGGFIMRTGCADKATTSGGDGITYEGRLWCKWDEFTITRDITGVIDHVNRELVTLGNPLRVGVCYDAVRATLRGSVDCATLTPTQTGDCLAWGCKAQGSVCVSTGAVGP